METPKVKVIPYVLQLFSSLPSWVSWLPVGTLDFQPTRMYGIKLSNVANEPMYEGNT